MNDSNDFGGADRPVRVEDVAREAGVSPITVSRALSTPHKVRAATRERVMEAVARTGYVVNSIASTLRSGRSSIVTVFTASLQNPHYANAVQGIFDAFQGSRFHLMFGQTGYSDDIGSEVVESIQTFRPAGVMFTGIVRDEATRNAVRALSVPVVEMWGEHTPAIDMLVGSSIQEAGHLVGQHFVEQGYRQIAYCGHVRSHGGSGLVGFREALQASGDSVGYVLTKEDTGTFASGITALNEILAAFPLCDAIFFGSDLLAAGAILSAREQNIAVPGRVAIAGYGDLDFALHVIPPLTSVTVSDYETGKSAGSMLRRRLEGDTNAEPVRRLSVRLTARGSTLRK
ncbi:MAG: LacI family DNA-binding transcriptional regulator [Devosia sp.]